MQNGCTGNAAAGSSHVIGTVMHRAAFQQSRFERSNRQQQQVSVPVGAATLQPGASLSAVYLPESPADHALTDLDKNAFYDANGMGYSPLEDSNIFSWRYYYTYKREKLNC